MEAPLYHSIQNIYYKVNEEGYITALEIAKYIDEDDLEDWKLYKENVIVEDGIEKSSTNSALVDSKGNYIISEESLLANRVKNK